MSEKFLNDETHIFGYGGNHIDDAGICFIDNITKVNSNYCFVDFFSTAYVSISDSTIEYIETIIYKLTESKCKIIFLFFLCYDHDNRIDFYNFIKEYLNNKNLYYIDINDFLKYDSKLLRDNVHTTEFGSEEYAKIIYDKFQKDKNIIEYPINIVKTKYCINNLNKLQVNKIFKDTLFLEGDCLIIAFYLIIGPKSGIIEINGEKESIWDQWCHYDRFHFNLKNKIVKDKLEVKILQENIDYTSCRRNIGDINIEKELNIVDIYYIGDKLNIIN